jgi:hypothetical protein
LKLTKTSDEAVDVMRRTVAVKGRQQQLLDGPLQALTETMDSDYTSQVRFGKNEFCTQSYEV